MLAPEGHGWISNASLATVKWPCGLHGREVREAPGFLPRVPAGSHCWELKGVVASRCIWVALAFLCSRVWQ